MVIPKLYTVDGLACLTELVYTLAGDEHADPDCRRAARMIVAHSSGDVDGFNAVIDEVAESHRGSELLIGMYAVFSAFVPVLYGEAGLSVLQRSGLHWAAEEESGRDPGPAPGIRPRVPSLLEDLGLFDHGVAVPVVPRPRRRFRIRCVRRSKP